MRAQDVAAAAAAWIWIPEDATVFSTEQLLLVRWPLRFGTVPTLLHLDPASDVDLLFNEAEDRAQTWGDGGLEVWVRPDSHPGLEQLLQDADAEVVETVGVLALDLMTGVPDLAVPDDLEVRWQRDEPTTRDHLAVSAAAFERGSVPDDDEVRAIAADAAAAYDEGVGATAVAYLDGRAVATGGLTLADGVARLWGAGVVPDARGRGAYRAVLSARLAHAVERGATMALVKGRVETSAPVLERAGFTAYGEERLYHLSL